MVPLLSGTFILVSKPYDENSNAEEIKAMLDRVSILEDGIILYNEMPIVSAFSADTMLSRLHQLIENNDIKALLVDLENSKLPDFKVRSILQRKFIPIIDCIEVVNFSTGRNKLLNIALNFTLNTGRIDHSKIEITTSRTEGLIKIHGRLKSK